MKRQIKSIAAAAALALGTVAFTSLAATPARAADAAPAAAPSAAVPNGGIYAGDWLVRLRGIGIMPDASSNGTLKALNADVNNTIVPELDFTYMVMDNVGVELILGTSRNQVTSSLGRLGGVGVLPPTLLLQYHFNHAGKIRPYVGAGLNYTLFYNNGLQAGGQHVSIDNHSFGPALQAGVDIQVAKNVFVNADIKKIWMRTGASLNGSSLGTLYIDPLIVGIGVGMKF
ncbi:OmpW/AlkL family protein [Paraburkholderia caballeronis]|uniref:Outer membrane protein n=1 Tax=Paraburkholderia caballeronis TaxID=416943 RepID=A0A1H7IWU0_9BURK|nr:OmpW family outer membrane protein [Paraburkholderia caballeronis]PXW27658.1 outer membrane protein [Paraburkholderia caballeronis]PXX03132.1 outer membrane protein [Paraburkholderia caballeronis]RAK03857.1 outer membrane protein [Paraburkholderia caballeronis]TDV20964.1 outer membrane protein [Paraburkholderia caballeronis]TDV21393.1 outer membrane protein [Paraburkholderia caballeronis]